MGFGAERSSDPLPSACARGSVACLISVSQVFYCTCRAACWSCRSSFFFIHQTRTLILRIKLPCQACERHLTSPSETFFFLLCLKPRQESAQFTSRTLMLKEKVQPGDEKLQPLSARCWRTAGWRFVVRETFFWSFAAKLFGSVQLNNWSGWGICLIHKRTTPKNTRNLSGSV